jgi:hypothetical protein
MKLLFCPHCRDVLKLRYEMRTCECGRCWGLYEDITHARIGGDAIPLGIGNRSLMDALETRPEDGMGVAFAAFVMPKNVPSITDEGQGRTLRFRGANARAAELMEVMLSQEPFG